MTGSGRSSRVAPVQAATICKVFRFEAAHQLPDHDGKCRDLHGHSYQVEVELHGPIQVEGPKRGMVVDFSDVKRFWTSELEPLLDHRFLNDSLEGLVDPTTAENLAGWIFRRFEFAALPVVAVRVWETATSWAECRP
jgi:6-pyruvoyltetrahydropterin/6-carboxytetrahydropterin synthase